MARYEHLPIFRAAFDLALHLEKIVKHFSRYHKYTLGTELRERSRAVLERVITANSAVEGRQEQLLQLRAELEQLKVLVRLCHQSGGFATTRSYLYVSEQVVAIAKQNEGWLRSTVNGGARGRRNRSGESRHGQNPTC
jgi:hypothetical protein